MNSNYLRKPGDLVAHYRVRRLLGSGLEGNVYLVNDGRDGALRTLKILRGRNMGADAEHTAAYYRKLASVPTLKRFREWGVLASQRGVGDRPWLAFDYIAGETLAKRIVEGRIGDPFRVLMAVRVALAPIHRRGFAIGDFDRARNILVERGTGLIRFCDLDAGGPYEPPPTPKDDAQELLKLARRLWRAAGMTLTKEVVAAIAVTSTERRTRQRLLSPARPTARPP